MRLSRKLYRTHPSAQHMSPAALQFASHRHAASRTFPPHLPFRTRAPRSHRNSPTPISHGYFRSENTPLLGCPFTFSQAQRSQYTAHSRLYGNRGIGYLEGLTAPFCAPGAQSNSGSGVETAHLGVIAAVITTRELVQLWCSSLIFPSVWITCIILLSPVFWDLRIQWRSGAARGQ